MLTPQQIQLLRTGSDKEGLDFLATLPQDKVAQVLALMPAVRQRLAAAVGRDMRMMVESAAQDKPAARAQPGRCWRKPNSIARFRAIASFEEVLVDFWYNHFNVYLDKGADRFWFRL